MHWLPLTCVVLAACASSPALPTPLAAAMPVPPAINLRGLPERAADAPFRFLVAGHLYGDPAKTSTPAGTFVSAIDDMAQWNADLLICCGDTFRVGRLSCFDRTAAVLQRLPFPVFNAVGNHDVTDRAAYVTRFGPTFGAFVHAGCLFVVLDTEAQTWEIAGEQLAFLRGALAMAGARADVRAVFCFGHKLVYCHRQRYFDVLMGSNALDGVSGANRFVADVLPLLTGVAQRKPVFWFAGDIGIAHTLPVFADRDPISGVTFLATGLGDLPRDALLEVAVHGGEVRVQRRSLTGQLVGELADFGLATWSKHVHPDGIPKEIAAFRALLPK